MRWAQKADERECAGWPDGRLRAYHELGSYQS
jgi:hypothetical protein